MKYRNIEVIGTSHIAKQSVDQVRDAIESRKPDIVAVELDPNRYHSLKDTKQTKISFRDIFSIGVVGFLFALLGKWAQNKMGKLVGVMPGTEMLTAINAARKNKAEVKLIDQDISITLKRFSKAIKFKEILRFFLDILRTIFFRKREMERLGIESLDFTKVPSRRVIKKLTAEFRNNYPNAYRVLVTERNKIMAERLARISEDNPGKSIIAVVGAGHEEELVSLIKKFESKITYSFTVS